MATTPKRTKGTISRKRLRDASAGVGIAATRALRGARPQSEQNCATGAFTV